MFIKRIYFLDLPMLALANFYAQNIAFHKKAEIQYATKGLYLKMYDDKGWYLNSLQSFLK